MEARRGLGGGTNGVSTNGARRPGNGARRPLTADPGDRLVLFHIAGRR